MPSTPGVEGNTKHYGHHPCISYALLSSWPWRKITINIGQRLKGTSLIQVLSSWLVVCQRLDQQTTSVNCSSSAMSFCCWLTTLNCVLTSSCLCHSFQYVWSHTTRLFVAFTCRSMPIVCKQLYWRWRASIIVGVTPWWSYHSVVKYPCYVVASVHLQLYIALLLCVVLVKFSTCLIKKKFLKHKYQLIKFWQ